MTPFDTEGVIKYQLVFQPGPRLPSHGVQDLCRWQKQLQQHGLLGRDPTRYGGLAFGNLSRRLAAGGFIITASQQADCANPGPDHYAHVTNWHCAENRLVATGPAKPSSESLTHAALYDVDPRIGVIFHAHSPLLWQRRDQLGLASTANNIAYGTPAMATEVARLYQAHAFDGHGALTMGGHEDGILSFGRTVDEAGQMLLTLLKHAESLS